MPFVTMLIVGLVVGILARFFYPARVDADWVFTILLGVAGSFAAGIIFRMLRPERNGTPFRPARILASVLGGMLLIFGARMLHIL